MTAPLTILVLAGTNDARKVIERLCKTDGVKIIASLAGVTPKPLALPVPVHMGGFGGAEGLARFCTDNAVDVILDITHPFARHISRNAGLAAGMAGIPCHAYSRPAWALRPGWREFDGWSEMVAAVPAGERVFLAGGSASIEAFSQRNDIFLCARALNIEELEEGQNRVFINAMPNASVAEETAILVENSITLLCCKNSGGTASRAKLDAAEKLQIPVWLLGRRRDDTDLGSVRGNLGITNDKNHIDNMVSKHQNHDKLESIIDAVTRMLSK